MSVDLSLYLVADAAVAAAAGRDLADLAHQAAEGGATTVQVRAKDLGGAAFLDAVRRVADVLPPHVALVVNDRVDVFLAARAAGARVAGVHVGQSDLPPSAVRALIGADALLGLSAGTPAELAAASADPARVDYVGIGAVHPTRTKADAPVPLGVSGFRALVDGGSLPAVAIGGITVADVAGLRAAGAAGVAVSSAICAAADPRDAARALRVAWEDAA